MNLKDPPYLTPLIKSVLARCNKLRKAGKNAEAIQLADRINHLISGFQAKSLLNKIAGPAMFLFVCMFFRCFRCFFKVF